MADLVERLRGFRRWIRARGRRAENRLLSAFLAAGGPLSGYEACERSGLGPGSVYPLLERWAESGFVAFERGDPVSAEPGAPRLGMYQLTSAGLALAKGRTEGKTDD